MPPIVLVLGTSVVAGLLLGAVFFLGLRWTVIRLCRNEHAGRLLLTSALLRFAVVAVAMLALARWHPAAAPTALLGFVLARLVVVGRAPRDPEPARLPASRRRPGGPPWT